ncbi:hypothetical protein FV234_23260 [Methylobacterium sp. WL8]|nr:hypothetical protein FV234_23260 [Methylobacterium sp. WL8]
MMADGAEPKNVEAVLLDLALEGWRFQKLFARAMTKLDAGEALRFANQHRYFVRRIGESLQSVGIRLENVEGEPYDAGSAVTAINIADFEPDDELVVDQMIEPIVMNAAGLLRPGTVTLRKAGQ